MCFFRDEGGTVTPESQTDPEQGGGTTPDPEAAKAARRAAIEKLSIEAQKKAIESGRGDNESGSTVGDDLDLSELDPKVAAAVRKVIEEAKQKDVHVRTLARYGIEQARKVKALEIASEFGLDKDETAEIEKALSGANNPDALDLAGREVVIKLREDGSFSKVESKTTGTKPKKVDGDKLPPVDTGRGSGANRVQALMEKIDAIDPADPKAQEELAKLQVEVNAAQKQWEERQRRRMS